MSKGSADRTNDHKAYRNRRGLINFNPKCVLCETRKPIEQMRHGLANVWVCMQCQTDIDNQEETSCE